MVLLFGDPAPTFSIEGVSNPRYVFDTAAGRYLVLAFVPAGPEVARAVETLSRQRDAFNDKHACAFIVIVGKDKQRKKRADLLPGIRFLFDQDGSVATLFGVQESGWFLIDPALHVMTSVGPDKAATLVDRIPSLPPPNRHGGPEGIAPVLVTPRIFEQSFCDHLIALYRETGGEPSGFMREVDGVTKLMMNDQHKRRSDVLVEDETLQKQVVARLTRRLVPQIEKAFNFKPTRIERYLVARYDAETGGFFRPHRDNTTKGTAHRRFAVSINLNSDYDGGDLRFPEFGDRTYRPPPGGACVFSCSVLHEATAVTRGERFAFLPFLYDEDAAKVREENLQFLDPALLER
ncbi:2OG-Fe(II) oxygenase [Brevundimonas lenta]|uniref:Putative 2-oxoglutarate/Fe(II)-dependent dioxygenase YbiX/peroxiredoxin n=1 Tax=Brevundimonas lenta TaxID=424796 RepID=A0A7W6JE89_9CAUL|nr:2OG-Fe(II) oxygenase [Brevundimonas lenta]MBB4083496.1 putative 2-oxoglutarate/Fe(II)-dependent dioxygenase YbiX/peroxiredoxin [Brevundimonas lenta]